MKNKDWSFQTSWIAVLHTSGRISSLLLEEILAQAYEEGISFVTVDQVLDKEDAAYKMEIQHICERYQNLGLVTSFAMDFSPTLESALQQVKEIRESLGQKLPEPFLPPMFPRENSVWSYYKDWSVTLHDVEVVTPMLLEEILAQAHENGVYSVVIDIGFGIDGDHYILADDDTYRAENYIIQEKYQKLGLSVNFSF